MMPGKVKDAILKWKEFHDKTRPKFATIKKEGGVWPRRWGYAGIVSVCYYRSDKWEKDGTYNRYFHDHGKGRIKCWHPLGLVPGLRRESPPIKVWPEAMTVLGYSMGWDITRPDGDEEKYLNEPGELLCSFDRPNGEAALVVISEAGAIVAVFCGPGLKVEARGIVG